MAKIKSLVESYKTQAAIAMEQRARVAGKLSAARFIEDLSRHRKNYCKEKKEEVSV